MQLCDTATHKIFYDKLEFIYVEIAKFNKSLDELETLYDKVALCPEEPSTNYSAPLRRYATRSSTASSKKPRLQIPPRRTAGV